MYEGSVPAVSVIVPIYNVEPYLKQCVDSIRNQTMKEIEIILVDDGSPDNCPQMCDQFGWEDNRIRVVHQKNAGVSVARNRGLEMAAADWIVFVDPDDWLEHNAIEALYQYAIVNNCDVVHGIIYSNYSNRQELEEISDNELGDYLGSDIHDFVFPRTFAWHIGKVDFRAVWGAIYRKKILDENVCRFPEELRKCEDIIFNLYAFQSANKISVINIPVYHYRKYKGSVCHTFYPDDIESVSIRYLSEVTAFLAKYLPGENFWKYFNITVIGHIVDVSKCCGYGMMKLIDLHTAAEQLKIFCQRDECKRAIKENFVEVCRNYNKKKCVLILLLKMHQYHLVVLIRFCQAKFDKLFSTLRRG